MSRGFKTAALALLLTAMLAGAGFAFDRVVMHEGFTSTT